MPGAYLRIGELARRVGVTVDVLRAWERRYGVPTPSRTDGGFRLYSDADERRVRAMRSHMAAGLSAGEAAAQVRSDEAGPGLLGDLSAAAARFALALDDYDDATAHSALDDLLGAFTFETVARDVLLPYLGELGRRWEVGEASVAQEHFASSLLLGRLFALARGWGRGGGPRAVLACPPGELHELGLTIFGVALRDQGWRVVYLGKDTPPSTLQETARRLSPAAIVLAATVPEPFRRARAELAELAKLAPVMLAGPGAQRAFAERVGARVLDGDPVTAAYEIARDQERMRTPSGS